MTHSRYGNIHDVIGIEAWQTVYACSAEFSATLQTEIISTKFSDFLKQIMSHFNGLGALKAVLIIGTDYRKIDNTLYRY